MRRKLILAIRSLTPAEGRLFVALLAIFASSLIGLFWQLNQSWATEIPVSGGRLKEGIVGAPRLINPLLATSDTERDLAALIYSGLTRIDDTGRAQPDLAASVTVSPDELSYTFKLKPGLEWHDGAPLTADDVIFTVEKAQDPAIKSPRRAGWEGIAAEKIDDATVRFDLKQPYPAFLDSAAMGILPRHIWGQFDNETFSLNQFNIEPIGSGPYRVTKIKRDQLGIPEYYDLEPFAGFALAPAKIKLRLRFYRNEPELLAAYQASEIESVNAISAAAAKTLETAGARLIKNPLPRIFGVFFNQNKSAVLALPEVRAALDLSIDKTAIVNSVLLGYGQVIEGPLPPRAVTLPQGAAGAATSTATKTSGLEEAKNLLIAKGWTFDATERVWQKTNSKKETLTLSLTLAVPETPELRQAAELVVADWQKLGVQASLKIFELGDFTQYVIRPRQYEAILFGEILGRNLDLFAFWHSSQRLDPGLNIALYTNISVDKLLEETRTLSDRQKWHEVYGQIQTEIAAENPAIFLYSPYFLYVLPPEVKGVNLPPLNLASDRFLTANHWFIDSDRVWPIFATQN